MNVSEPDGCHDFVSILLIICIIYYIINIVGLITSPRHIFVPHPRHENVAIGSQQQDVKMLIVSQVRLRACPKVQTVYRS